MRYAAAFLAVVMAAAPLPACGVCVTFAGDGFSLPHPRAIEIAVATRKALDEGRLTSQRPDRAARGSWNRPEDVPAITLVKAWAQRPGAGTPAARRAYTLHIILIDSGERLAIHWRAGVVVVEARPRGASDAVLATSLPVLEALLDGSLRLAQARAGGLAVVEGEAPPGSFLLSPAYHNVNQQEK